MDENRQVQQETGEPPRESWWRRRLRFARTYPVFSFFLVDFLLGFLLVVILCLLTAPRELFYPDVLVLGTLLVALCLVFPLMLSIVNLAGVFLGPAHTKTLHVFAALTLVVGTALTYLYAAMMEITYADWWEVVYDFQFHLPIWSEAIPALAILVGLGLIGYGVLVFRRADQLPPLLIVLCMAAMYLWGIVCVVWCVQISGGKGEPFELPYLPLMILPVNCVFLILREIRMKILEWNAAGETRAQKDWTAPWSRLLQRAEYWPLLALPATLPILGLLLCVLALFGQAPDTLIRAFTETADWRLSEQLPPPSLNYDEHYLCTVAAGGDRRLVKPLRMGQRHGHRVVVNRQLQIANAFEQVLEERLPRTHRCIRHMYDTCGFPIARHIRTKLACDAVYLLMKPLEWVFLCVLYLTDVHPEDRIALQYLPKEARPRRNDER